MAQKPEKFNQYKIIIIGPSGCGKTAIIKRLCKDIFQEDIQATVGAQFECTVIDIGGEKIKLNIWDTAGQERFRSIAKSYFRNAVGVVIVFDITDGKSFDEIPSWIETAHSLCDPNAQYILIGNKSDLEQKREISLYQAETFAKQHNTIYMETSALIGSNIHEAFVRLSKEVYEKAPPIKINKNNVDQSEGSCGC